MKKNKLGIGERSDWGDFPEVVRNGNFDGSGDLRAQPEYEAAKHGDSRAAFDMVERLITDETIKQISNLIGRDKPYILPVQLVEENGNNKIPIAMAKILAGHLSLDVEQGIGQQEKLSRTGAKANHRLAFNPSFNGIVDSNKKYFIVDDTLIMGGTIASLRGYIENRGGKVIGSSVMVSGHRSIEPVNIVVTSEMLTAINQKHGEAMNNFWKEEFGYGIEKLTQSEAGHVRRSTSVDEIRIRIHDARLQGIRRMDGARNKKAPTPTGENQGELGLSERLLESARDSESKQKSLFSEVQVSDVYQDTLGVYVQAKHAQVGRIESQLKNLINRQQVKFQQLQRNPPGFLSLPKTRRTWQAQKVQQQARLQTLQSRLTRIVEIRVDSSHIQELATHKMRSEKPDLAIQMDNEKMATRRRKVEARMEKETQSKTKTISRVRTIK